MDKRIEKTKRAIQKAYVDLLLGKPGQRITVADIAKEANINRKTFYLHYETTDDIMTEVYEEKRIQFIEKIENADYGDGTKPIRKIFEVCGGIVSEDIEFFRCVVRYPEYNYLLLRIREMLGDIVKTNYRYFFSLDDKQLDIYLNLFISGILSVFTYWLEGKIDCDMMELADIVSNASENGFGNTLTISLKK